MEPTSFLGPRAVSGTVVDRRLVEPATQWPGFYLKSYAIGLKMTHVADVGVLYRDRDGSKFYAAM